MADPNFGADCLSWLNGATSPDLDPTFALVAGTNPLIVAENIARRWLSDPIQLEAIGDDPLGGYDLRAELKSKLTERNRLRLRTKLAAVALRDERVDAIVVDVTQSVTAGTLTVAATVETASGPFDLVLLVTATTAELLKPTG